MEKNTEFVITAKGGVKEFKITPIYQGVDLADVISGKVCDPTFFEITITVGPDMKVYSREN